MQEPHKGHCCGFEFCQFSAPLDPEPWCYSGIEVQYSRRTGWRRDFAAAVKRCERAKAWTLTLKLVRDCGQKVDSHVSAVALRAFSGCKSWRRTLSAAMAAVVRHTPAAGAGAAAGLNIASMSGLAIALGALGQWTGSLEVLKTCLSSRLKVDGVLCSAVARGCAPVAVNTEKASKASREQTAPTGKRWLWQRATQIFLGDRFYRALELDVVAYGAAIEACGSWGVVLRLLEHSLRSMVETNASVQCVCCVEFRPIQADTNGKNRINSRPLGEFTVTTA